MRGWTWPAGTRNLQDCGRGNPSWEGAPDRMLVHVYIAWRQCENHARQNRSILMTNLPPCGFAAAASGSQARIEGSRRGPARTVGSPGAVPQPEPGTDRRVARVRYHAPPLTNHRGMVDGHRARQPQEQTLRPSPPPSIIHTTQSLSCCSIISFFSHCHYSHSYTRSTFGVFLLREPWQTSRPTSTRFPFPFRLRLREITTRASQACTRLRSISSFVHPLPASIAPSRDPT